MSPSNGTVVRFVASYGHGFSFPVRRLILGHGYQNYGGLAHSEILEIYLGKKILIDVAEKVYAGYLHVEDGQVKIFSGGSQTLEIPSDKAKNDKFLDDLKHSRRMNTSVIALFPLITNGTVYHTMIAQG